MIKSIINALKAYSEQQKAQNTLNALIGKRKKSEYIKIKIPKKYILMLELLARYGINDFEQLNKILRKHTIKS